MNYLRKAIALGILAFMCIMTLTGLASADVTTSALDNNNACEAEGTFEKVIESTTEVEAAGSSYTEGFAETQKIEDERPCPPATRANVDIAIYKMEVVSTLTGSTTHYPGQLCTINVTVFNYGLPIVANTPIDVICAVNDGFHNSTIQTTTFTKGLAGYQMGIDNTTVQFPFTPPLTPPVDYVYPHSFGVVATVVMANDEVQSNNQKSLSLGVMKADFNPLLEVGTYDKISGRPDPTGWNPIKAKVGETLTIPVTIFNYGSGQDMIKVDCIKKPLNWSVSSFDKIQLDDEENTTDDLTLIVSISKWRQDALKNYDYIVTLKAYSLNYPLAESTTDVHFSIDFSGGLEIQTPYSEKWVAPGTILYIDSKVINKGNGKDSYYTRLEDIGDSAKKQGWVAYVYSGGLTPAINRDESRTVTIRVSVPPNVLKGAHCKVTMTTSSNTDTSVKKSVSIEVYASRLYAPVVESQEPFYEVYPGQESLIYFNLTNNGNGRDPSIQLKIGKQPDGWVTGLDLSEIPSGGVAYKSTVEIGLKLILPDSIAAKDGYEVVIQAWAGDPLFKSDECTLVINVLEKFSTQVTVFNSMKYGYVGGVVEYTATIKNRGNVEDVFTISAKLQNAELYPGWNIELSDTSVNLSANMTKSLIIYVSIPLTASADTNLATSSVYEGYYIDLIARSLNDPKNATDTEQIITKVNPVYSFSLSCKDKYAKISGDRTDVLPFTIDIVNTGNIKDIVDFSVETNEKWYSLVTVHKFVPYQESRQAVINIEPKKGLAPGTYTFEFIGKSRGDKTYTQSILFTIDVISFNFKIDNVRIYNKPLSQLQADGKYDPAAGYTMSKQDTILITADITNTGDEAYIAGPYGEVIISFYDGQIPITKFRTNLTYVEPYSESKRVYTVSLPWNTTAAEDKGTLHQLIIRVDPQDKIPENNENDNSKYIFVTVYGTTAEEDGDEGPWPIILNIIVPLAIAIIIIVVAILTWNAISSIRITVVDTGYNDDGEYKPFAQKDDAFEGERNKVIEEEEVEIEYNPEHPYSTAAMSPYAVANAPKMGPAPTPFALPPSSPYSMVGVSPDHPYGGGQSQISGLLPPAQIEQTKPETQITPPPVESVQPEVGEPVKTAPVTTAPVASKPVTTAPVTSKPVTTAPVASKPVTTAPVTSKPVTTAPVTTAPVASKPVTTAPVTTAPVASKPVTTAPVTTAPVASKPVTTAPVTTAPVASKPVTTAPVTTAPADTTKPAGQPQTLKELLAQN